MHLCKWCQFRATLKSKNDQAYTKFAKSVPRSHIKWTSRFFLRTQMIYSYSPCFPSRCCCVYLLLRGYCCFKVLIAQVRLKGNDTLLNLESYLQLDTRRWIPQLKPLTHVFVYLSASIFLTIGPSTTPISWKE